MKGKKKLLLFFVVILGFFVSFQIIVEKAQKEVAAKIVEPLMEMRTNKSYYCNSDPIPPDPYIDTCNGIVVSQTSSYSYAYQYNPRLHLWVRQQLIGKFVKCCGGMVVSQTSSYSYAYTYDP
jgi:hypothetical protein